MICGTAGYIRKISYGVWSTEYNMYNIYHIANYHSDNVIKGR